MVCIQREMGMFVGVDKIRIESVNTEDDDSHSWTQNQNVNE
jgi:hypothetical protein